MPVRRRVEARQRAHPDDTRPDFWQRLLAWLGLDTQRTPSLPAETEAHVRRLAEQEGRTMEAVTADLLASGLRQHHLDEQTVQRWNQLSIRQQEVTALTCLGYTNRQIAARLGISPETVKTHLGKALLKFDVHSKAELRSTLHGWNFEEFEAI